MSRMGQCMRLALLINGFCLKQRCAIVVRTIINVWKVRGLCITAQRFVTLFHVQKTMRIMFTLFWRLGNHLQKVYFISSGE